MFYKYGVLFAKLVQLASVRLIFNVTWVSISFFYSLLLNKNKKLIWPYSMVILC